METRNLVTVIKYLLPEEWISNIVSVPSIGKRDKRNEKLLEPGSGRSNVEEILEA